MDGGAWRQKRKRGSTNTKSDTSSDKVIYTKYVGQHERGSAASAQTHIPATVQTGNACEVRKKEQVRRKDGTQGEAPRTLKKAGGGKPAACATDPRRAGQGMQRQDKSTAWYGTTTENRIEFGARLRREGDVGGLTRWGSPGGGRVRIKDTQRFQPCSPRKRGTYICMIRDKPLCCSCRVASVQYLTRPKKKRVNPHPSLGGAYNTLSVNRVDNKKRPEDEHANTYEKYSPSSSLVSLSLSPPTRLLRRGRWPPPFPAAGPRSG